MGEDIGDRSKGRFRTGYAKADARTVHHLAHGTGKGRFAALVRAGNDDDSLNAFEIEAVGDGHIQSGKHIVRKGKIKHFGGLDALAFGGKLRAGKEHAALFDGGDIIEIAEIELHFKAKALGGLVEEFDMLLAEGIEVNGTEINLQGYYAALGNANAEAMVAAIYNYSCAAAKYAANK